MPKALSLVCLGISTYKLKGRIAICFTVFLEERFLQGNAQKRLVDNCENYACNIIQKFLMFIGQSYNFLLIPLKIIHRELLLF